MTLMLVTYPLLILSGLIMCSTARDAAPLWYSVKGQQVGEKLRISRSQIGPPPRFIHKSMSCSISACPLIG